MEFKFCSKLNLFKFGINISIILNDLQYISRENLNHPIKQYILVACMKNLRRQIIFYK